MNEVRIIGRVVKDPFTKTVTKQDGSTLAIADFTLAVDGYHKAGAQSKADFIPCTALGKNAEFAQKYLTKGTKILIYGAIKTNSYVAKDGNTVYKTYVNVDRYEFVEPKKQDNGFVPISDAVEEFNNIPDVDTPFN